MTGYAFASAKGAPGVTTSVLALAWQWPAATGGQVLVVDADLAGSGMVPGLLRDHPDAGTGGLLALAASRDADLSGQLTEASVGLDEAGDRRVLAGVSDPVQARALDSLWPRLLALVARLHEDGTDVLIDTGRATSHAPHPLWDGAEQRVLVTGSRLPELAAARPLLREHPATSVLLVGPGRPYPVTQVRAALERDDVLSVPWDPGTARVFSDGAAPGWRFARSPLLRAAPRIAATLTSPVPVGVAR